MLVDVHAHFYHQRTPRADWRERNESRITAGARIGISVHVASILGSFGLTSPTYFPSPRDVTAGNDALLALQRAHPDRIRGYVCVNPNYGAHARAEIVRCLDAGMIGIKLAASRRADDPLLDPIAALALERRVPVLQHVWQHRRRDWTGQEASDASELCTLARRHPDAHRWGRGLAALAACLGGRAQRLRRSLGQRRGWRHARILHRQRRCESPALGQRHHDGHGLGEAPLPRDLPLQGRHGLGALEECHAHLPARRVSDRLMRIDCNAFLGAYPWRKVPGTSPDALVHALERTQIDVAWITHLPSLFWRDPTAGNAWLYETARQEKRFKPVPTVHPGLAQWEQVVADAANAGAPAVRRDPLYLGLEPAGGEMRVLAAACSAARIPLMLAVRLEDGRQRHPNDHVPELPAAAVRALIRSDADVRLLVTHADRAFVEEVHFGSTPEEARRIWWDICWLWGPPEDHLATLLDTIGPDRFVFGTGQPLRLPENSVAKLDLLDIKREAREAIESKNLQGLLA